MQIASPIDHARTIAILRPTRKGDVPWVSESVLSPMRSSTGTSKILGEHKQICLPYDV